MQQEQSPKPALIHPSVLATIGKAVKAPVTPKQHARFSALVVLAVTWVSVILPDLLTAIAHGSSNAWVQVAIKVGLWLFAAAMVAWVHYEVVRHDPIAERIILFLSLFLKEIQAGAPIPGRLAPYILLLTNEMSTMLGSLPPGDAAVIEPPAEPTSPAA